MIPTIRTLSLILALLATPAMAVTSTVRFVLDNAHWTDLGPGPLLLGFKGAGVFAVSDTTPTIPLTEGFTMISGDSRYITAASHVWAMSLNNQPANAYVSAY